MENVDFAEKRYTAGMCQIYNFTQNPQQAAPQACRRVKTFTV